MRDCEKMDDQIPQLFIVLFIKKQKKTKQELYFVCQMYCDDRSV